MGLPAQGLNVNAQEFLEKRKVLANDVVDARTTRIDADAAWEMLNSAKTITVAKGKKVQRFDRIPGEKETILQQVIGPSGNLRAPTYRVGDNFIIGFNQDLYADWVK